MKKILSLVFLFTLFLTSLTFAASPLKELSGKLVTRDGKPYDVAQIDKADYVAIYFSAHWCPPCRKFTPKLVEFYNKVKPSHSNFELVFVSFDHSEKDMYSYMADMNMPWPALSYKLTQSKDNPFKSYAGNGIPHLVFMDKTGKVIASSIENGQYVGPYKVLPTIEKTLQASH